MTKVLVQFDGDWKRARSIFQGLAFRMNEAVGHGAMEDVRRAERRIKANIYGQNYVKRGLHPELADSTRERKAREGKDTRVLIEDGDYVRSIKAMHLGRGVYAIGVRADDEENAEKGIMHEFGGRGPKGPIPARPHYRPELERLRQERLPSVREGLNRVLKGRR